MKKSLFLLLPFLVSCSSTKLNENILSAEKEKVFNHDYNSVDDKCFIDNLEYSLDNDMYLYTYSLTNKGIELNNVHVILQVIDSDTYFFFGYEKKYKLVTTSNDVEKEKGYVLGIKIYFSSTVKIESLYGYLNSDEKEVFYKIELSK